MQKSVGRLHGRLRQVGIRQSNVCDEEPTGHPCNTEPHRQITFDVNEKDHSWVDSKVTPQPVGVALQPIPLTGARDRVAKKTYIRAASYPQPIFDKYLAICKADRTWRTFEIPCGHHVMVDIVELTTYNF